MAARDAPRHNSLLVLLFFTALLFGVQAFAEAPRVNVSIPDGPAQRTFQLFFAQTRIEILYLAETVKDVQTHAVAGTYDADEAVRRMLEGTDLEFQFFQNYSFVSLRPRTEIKQAAGAPNAPPLSGKQPERELPEPPAVPLVTVTGTYIPGAIEIPSPLVTTTRREANSSSYATLQDALQKLPMASKSGPSEDLAGSGNFNRGSSINLRGLGTGATLVLVNGRRQPASGLLADFVDVSSIPIFAIDRVEVLPDGASALYGSDAIAGVVNIVLREKFEGVETFLRQGSAQGGANETLASLLLGTHWTQGRIWAGYQFVRRTKLSALARAYSASSDKRSVGGSDLRSIESSPGNIYNPFTLVPAYGLPDKQGDVSLADLSSSLNFSDRAHYEDLLPDRKQHNAVISASQRFGRVDVSIQGRFTRRDMEAQYSPAERPLVIPATNPFVVNPFPAPIVYVGYSFANEFGPIVAAGRTDSSEAYLNLESKLRGWNLALKGWVGVEEMMYRAYNQPEIGALTAALNSRDRATAFDAFGRMTSPSTLAGILDVQKEAARSEVRTAQFIARRPIPTPFLKAGDTTLVVGVERRSDLFESGVRLYREYPRRHVDALFTELAIPIIGDPSDERDTPRFDLSIAARHEAYSDFGSTTNPKIGLRWAPNDRFKLRGSWGKSFRAPRVTDLYDTTRNRAGLSSLIDPASPTGRSLVLIREGSNPDLHEEKARTWTVGFDTVIRQLWNARLSGTYFNTSYAQRITAPAASAPFDILRQGERWHAAIDRTPTQAEIDAVCEAPGLLGPIDTCKSAKVAAIVDYRFRNLASTQASGIDLSLGFDKVMPLGVLHFDLLSSYYLNLEQSVSPGSPYISELNTVGNPMRFRGRATLGWWEHAIEAPGFNASLSVDYSSDYRDIDAARRVDALTTIDTRLGFRTERGDDVFSGLELSLNVANVFNQRPPFVNRELGYDALNADPYGQVWSLMLEKRW